MEIVISVILLFVGIAILVAIHVCVVGRAFRGGYDSTSLVSRISSINNDIRKISNKELNNLPCFDYKAASEKEAISTLDCAVCLENFKVGDKCRLLPNCNHSFHSKCIDSWLLKNPICPICRTGINPPKTCRSSVAESAVSVDVDVEVELT